jgi:hypothetical protein
MHYSCRLFDLWLFKCMALKGRVKFVRLIEAVQYGHMMNLVNLSLLANYESDSSGEPYIMIEGAIQMICWWVPALSILCLGGRIQS